MPWPVGLPLGSVNFGAAVVTQSGVNLPMRVTVDVVLANDAQSKTLVFRPTGQPLVGVTTTFDSDPDTDSHSMALPLCDTPNMGYGNGTTLVLDSTHQFTHVYKVTIDYLTPGSAKAPIVAMRTVKSFVLTTGQPSGDIDDLLLIPSPSNSFGIPVSVPDTWSAQIAAAEQAAQDAADSADRASEVGNATVAGFVTADGATKTAVAAATQEAVARGQNTGTRHLPGYGGQAAKFAAGVLTRCVWLTQGDSMAQGIFESGFDAMRRQFGGIVRGVYFAGSSRSVTANASTGTITEATTAYDVWTTGLVSTFTTGATRTYGVGGAAFMSDTIVGFYIKEANAGTFKIQVDGADVAGFTDISAVGTGLGVAVLTVPRGAHTAKFVNLTGTVRQPLYGMGFEDSTVSGLVVANISKGGLDLPNALDAAQTRANLQTALAAIAPTVISYEAKEGAAGMQARMTQLLDIYAAAAPLADVILTATPEVGGPAYSDVPEQNAILRTVAANYPRAVVFDADRAFGSYATALANGFYDAGEVTHYNDLGKRYLWGLYSATFGLLTRAGNPARSVNNAVEQSTTYGPDPTDPVMVLIQDSGFDILSKMKRAWRFLSTTGVADANSWVVQPNGSNDQQIPNGVRIGLLGPFLRSITTELGALMSARGGGTDKSLRVRSLVQTPQALAHSASGARVIDLSLGTLAIVTLTANVTAWSFTNPVSVGELIEVHWVQGAGGPFTLAGRAGVIDLIGGSLTLSTAVGARDVSTFRYVTGARYVEVSRTQGLA